MALFLVTYRKRLDGIEVKHVVNAPNEAEAREVAAIAGGGIGMEVWRDPVRTKIELLGASHPPGNDAPRLIATERHDGDL